MTEKSESKKFDKLNETFNVSGEVVETEIIKETHENKIGEISNSIQDIKKDYEYTRANLYSLIEKGSVSSRK